MKADAERPDDVEHVAGLDCGEAVGAASHALVEKLDAAVGAVDAIDALRPAQPQFAGIGRRAQQIEELARLDGHRLGRRHQHQVLVVLVDPGVGDDRAQRLLGRNMGIGGGRLALAYDERRRCKHFTHQTTSTRTASLTIRRALRVRSPQRSQ